MKEVRNALFAETAPAAQGQVAAQQLLEEVRTERERRTAEKHYLEEQMFVVITYNMYYDIF